MKTQLLLAEHSELAGEFVIELWYDGQFIGTVTGDEGPGVRIISKYPVHPVLIGFKPNLCEVQILVNKKGAT